MVYQWHVARDSKIIQSQMSGSQQQTGHANSSHALPHTALCANASIQTRHTVECFMCGETERAGKGMCQHG